MKIEKAIKLGFKQWEDGKWRRPVTQRYKDGRVFNTWTLYHLKQCEKCSAEYLASHSRQEFCSGKCSSTGRPSAMKGVSFQRKGSYGRKRFASNGYVEIYMPGHILADTHGRVLEHRLVIYNQIKRPLVFNDVVHHINGIRSDNRPENLVLLTRGDHNSHHKSEEAIRRIRGKSGRFL